MSHVASLLAHQGGWDEILLVAGPIAVIVGLLWLAKRRLGRHVDRPSPAADAVSEPRASDQHR